VGGSIQFNFKYIAYILPLYGSAPVSRRRSVSDGVLSSPGLQAEENLGMVMIFTLVTAVQEKLNEMVGQVKHRREEEKLRQELEAEEAEEVREGDTKTLKRSDPFLHLNENDQCP